MGRGPLLVGVGLLLFSGVAIAQSASPDGSTQPATQRSPWVQEIADDRDAVVQYVLDHDFIGAEGQFSDSGELETALDAISDDRLRSAAEAETLEQLESAIAGGPVPSEPLPAGAFGEATTNLVFTPIEPCRLFDTRFDTRGPLTSNEVRNFAVQGVFVSDQGGHSSDCPAVPFDPPAVAIALSAAQPTGTGNARIYSALGTVPPAVSITYRSALTYTNTTTSPVCISCGAQTDIAVKVSAAQAQIVGDIVGYFSRGPFCPAGTTAAGGQCFDTNLRADNNFFNASNTCESLGRRLPTVGELMLVLNDVAGDTGGEHSDSTYFDGTFKNMRVTSAGGLVDPTSTLQTDPFRCVTNPID